MHWKSESPKCTAVLFIWGQKWPKTYHSTPAKKYKCAKICTKNSMIAFKNASQCKKKQGLKIYLNPEPLYTRLGTTEASGYFSFRNRSWSIWCHAYSTSLQEKVSGAVCFLKVHKQYSILDCRWLFGPLPLNWCMWNAFQAPSRSLCAEQQGPLVYMPNAWKNPNLAGCLLCTCNFPMQSFDLTRSQAFLPLTILSAFSLLML